MPIFYYLLDTALVNCFVIGRYYHRKEREEQNKKGDEHHFGLEFRRSIALQMMKK
jgi:hypothetical protein